MSERKAMLAWALPSEKEESEAKPNEKASLTSAPSGVDLRFSDKPSAKAILAFSEVQPNLPFPYGRRHKRSGLRSWTKGNASHQRIKYFLPLWI